MSIASLDASKCAGRSSINVAMDASCVTSKKLPCKDEMTQAYTMQVIDTTFAN